MKRKTALIAAIVISSAMAALTFSALVHAGDKYSEDGNPIAHLSPMEPIFCSQYKGSLLCTAKTSRQYNRTTLQLIARKAGGMIRPKEIVQISKGFWDVRAPDAELKRIYIATPSVYAEMTF